MKHNQAIAKLEEALKNATTAIEAFHDSGSMCEETFDALLNAKRMIEFEIADLSKSKRNVCKNTMDMINANCD